MYVPIAQMEADAKARHQSAEEYLNALLAKRFNDFYEKFSKFDTYLGLKTELVDGVPVQKIVNRAAYAKHLARYRLTSEELTKLLEFEESVSYDNYLTNMTENKMFLEKIARECIELTGQYKQMLNEVPLKFGHLGLFDAGAIPVPSGGSAVLISTSILMVRFWIAWLALFMPTMQRPPDVSFMRMLVDVISSYVPNWAARLLLSPAKPPASSLSYDTIELNNLLGALPDLARHIVNNEGFPRFMVYARIAIPILNNNAVGWAGEFVERFIILHELGHVALGHTDQIREWDNRKHKAEELARVRRRFELDADQFAGHALRKFYPPEEAGKGLMALFSLFYFAEGSSVIDELATHPPAFVRYEIACEAYSEQPLEDLDRHLSIMAMLKGGSEQIRQKASDAQRR